MRSTLFWFIAAAVPMAGADTQPRALVLEAPEGVEYKRADDKAAFPARAGELLYAGDRLSTRRGKASVVHCGARTVYSLGLLTTALVEETGIRSLEGEVREAGHAEQCELPETPTLYASDHHRGAWDGAGLPALPPPASNLTPLARLARAKALATAGRHADSLAEFMELQSRHWPGQPWLQARIFHHKAELIGSVAPPPATPGRTFALVVGISNYASERIGKLRYARADAELFSAFLASPRGGAVPPSNLNLLTDAKATRAKIQDGIDAILKERLTAADTVVLFFACHAGPDMKDGSLYMLTHDANPEDLRVSGLRFEYLHKLLTSSSARAARVLLFLDTCHAGELGALPWAPGAVHSAAENSSKLNSRCFLALAAGPDQLAWEHPRFGGGHGAFTWYLYKGLHDGDADLNRDRLVDSGEAVRFLTTALPDAVAAMHRELKTKLPRSPDPKRRISVEQQPRFVGSYFDSEILAWLDRAPIKPVPAPGPATNPEKPGSRGLDFEEAGQSVMLDYLKGEEIPLRRDDFDRAAASFAAARRDVPDSLWLESRELFCRGRVAIFEKRYDEAGALLARAVTLDPTAAFAYNALGIAHLERADFDRAQAAFADTIRRAPYWSYAWHNLALTYTQRGDYRAAERTYRRAVELAPRTAYLRHNLGLLYQNMNRRREAAGQYRRAIDLRPERPESYSALGALRAMERHYREAEQLLRKAVTLAPEKPEARHNLALAVGLGRSRPREKEELLRWNVEHHPDFLPSRLALAKMLASGGRRAEAIAEYEELLRRAPAYAAAREEMEKLKNKRGR